MTTEQAEPAQIPVLLSLWEITQIAPVNAQTVYRWNMAPVANRPALPTPDLVVGNPEGNPTKLWREDVVVGFLRSLGHEPDVKVLKQIRKRQGHR